MYDVLMLIKAGLFLVRSIGESVDNKNFSANKGNICLIKC